MLSTNISSHLSKDEITSVSQSGVLEIMNFIINSIKSRRINWALTCIQNYSYNKKEFALEKECYIEEINELRYDKHSLLEDNASLRLHNEALIEQLERTNDDFYSLSILLNEMKIARMVSVLSKLMEIPILDAFFVLRYNTENYYKY
jgi:hypothetical protein